MDIDKLKVELFKKQKAGMLQKLFQLNPKQNEVSVTIVLNDESNAMIVPYRNIKCKQLECLYDEDELIQLCQQNNKKVSFAFSCKICKTKINFQDFFLDEDLYEKINRVFGCYNKTEVAVKEIIFNKQGGYFLKFLKKPGQFIVRDNNLPSMREYSDEEYQQMRERFEKQGKEAFVSTDTILSRMGLSLTFEQLELLYEEYTTSIPLMAFLLNYAYNHQENQYEKKGLVNVKKNLGIITLIIFGLNAQKQLEAEYLTNFENYYQSGELVQNYENVAVVIYYEKTWSLLLVDLNKRESHFYIFKDHMKDEYVQIISAVIAEQFDMKNSVINYVDNFSFHSPTEAKYSGTIVFRLLMWLIDPPANPQPFSEFSYQTIDLIRKQTSIIEWLLFKMMKQDKKTEYIFSGMKSQQINSNEGSMPSIISLQGITSPLSTTQQNTDSNLKDQKRKKKKKLKQDNNQPIEEEDDDEQDQASRDINSGYNQDNFDEDNEDQFNFQQEFEELKAKYGKKNNVNIPKSELDNLVEKLQYDVSKEITRRRKQEEIEKETLADYYINKKLQEFDIKVRTQKSKKKKKNRKGGEGEEDPEEEEDDIIQQYERGEITKQDILEKQQVQLSVGQLKDILKQFEVDMHKRIDFKQKNNVSDAVDKEREVSEYMEWYNTFIQLLHYYYNYDIDTYKQLIDEYNFRFHNMIFHKLGLDWQSSKNSKNNNLNNSQHSNQQYNSLIQQDIINNSSMYNNNQFKNQFDYGKKNSLLRNSFDNRNDKGPSFNIGSTLAQAGMSSLISQSNSSKNEIPIMGQRYKEAIINGENNKIIAQRYQKTITESDIIKLKSGNILTEDGLNFFLKYLEERLNQKEYPKGMRMLYLSVNFYKYYSKRNPLQQDDLDFKSVRHYMKPYTGENNSIFDKFDKIFIPVLLTLNEMHLVVINIITKELILYITSTFQGYPQEAVNNPILQNLMRFLQKELYEKKMKNLNFLNWKCRYIYLDEQYIQKYKQSTFNVAFITNMITKLKDYQSQPLQEYISFNQRLVRLFSQIGITQNKRNEIIIENLPL